MSRQKIGIMEDGKYVELDLIHIDGKNAKAMRDNGEVVWLLYSNKLNRFIKI